MRTTERNGERGVLKIEKKEMTVTDIKRIIDDDYWSERKIKAREGQRYYDAEHDILQCRLFYYNADGKLVEDHTRANIKISHPFFTELADQLAPFILSFDENPIQAKEKAEGLQDYLDEYFDDEFWSEIADLITGAYVKGWDYIYTTKNTDNRLTFQYADSLGIAEVRAKDTDANCECIIYWYIDRIEKGQKEIKRIQVWDKDKTTYYVQEGDGAIIKDNDAPVNPRPHVVFTDPKTNKKMGYGLGYIPFFRLDNCKKRYSGLKPIKRIIDDYDLHACSLSNNLKDFDTPLHVVTGFQGSNLDELQTNLKTKKVIGVDEGGGVEVRTVDIPFEARKVKLDIDEKNIYRFGMGFNSSQVGDGNVTNVVIRSRYTLLELKAEKLERRLRKLLKSIIKIVLAEINQENETDFTLSDIKPIKFPHGIMTNETENIANEKVKAETQQIKVNTILNIAANVGDEQTLRALCDVMDWDFDELQREIEKRKSEGIEGAQTTLDGIVPIEPKEPIEEPIEEEPEE